MRRLRIYSRCENILADGVKFEHAESYYSEDHPV
jgi:hypothetical protein